jgi:hypothetical protein
MENGSWDNPTSLFYNSYITGDPNYYGSICINIIKFGHTK